MTHRGSGLPFPSKMDVFQAEIGGDQGFVSRRNADAGAVIPNADYPAGVSRA